MKFCELTCVFILASGTIHAETADVCPKLPIGSALNWEYQQGPDFGVCRATRDKKQVFGIYLGNFPSLQESSLTQGKKGNVGGFEVLWIDMKPSSSSISFAKQTVIKIHKSPGTELAHVWVEAADAKELEQTLEVLSNIEF